MTLKMRLLAGAVALAIGTIDSQFRAAVGKVLNSVRNGNDYLSGLSASEFRDFVRCAQHVMDGALRPDKQYVLAGKNLSEQRARFDQISNKVPIDGSMTLKRKVSSECAI